MKLNLIQPYNISFAQKEDILMLSGDTIKFSEDMSIDLEIKRW